MTSESEASSQAESRSRPAGTSDDARKETERESCVKYFDALWFCYCKLPSMFQAFIYYITCDTIQVIQVIALACCACQLVVPPKWKQCPYLTSAVCLGLAPVYQIQQYYRFGNADDCMGHWSDLYACLKKRTKFAHQVLLSHPDT